MNRKNNWNYTKVKTVRTGIKSRTRRGRLHSSNWWSRRWFAILESCIDSGRLSRGKTYARKGQVTNIKIEPGLVTAFVQGRRERPYQTKLGFQTVSEMQQELLLLRFRERASFAAKLLAMEMPEEMEIAFNEAGIPLFPDKDTILRFKCSCPDDATPCKHIVAVLLLLAEVIDENPFLLIKLRGLNRRKLITHLTSETIYEKNDEFADFNEGYRDDICSASISGGTDSDDIKIIKSEEPLPTGKEWYGNNLPLTLFIKEDPHKHIAALEIMNNFPFWRGEKSFLKTVAPYYERAIDRAAKILSGEKKSSVGRPKKLT